MGFTPPATRPVRFEPFRTGHAVGAALEPLLAQIDEDPVLRGDRAPGGGGPVALRSRLWAGPAADGGAVVERFWWCAQWRDPAVPGGYGARTLLYDARRGAPAVFAFPEDPRLPAAAAPDGPLTLPGVDVLRYIPLRRMTYRGATTVVKLKRPASLARSYARVAAAFAATRGSAVRAPEPRGLDCARGRFEQELLPGRPLVDVITADTAERLLGALGAFQAAVHALPTAGLPALDPAAVAGALAADAAAIAFAVPEHAAALGRVVRRLTGEIAASGAGEQRFCHGDPALDQFLLDGDDLAMVDLEDAAAGDPYADLGALLAALRADVPELCAGAAGERLAAAYLDGYRERAGTPLDERRLGAHRERADLAVLAGRLRRGRATTAESAAAVARLDPAPRRARQSPSARSAASTSASMRSGQSSSSERNGRSARRSSEAERYQFRPSGRSAS
jgi:aminoglycoside phosphotransferase (APT) family kinase protein